MDNKIGSQRNMLIAPSPVKMKLTGGQILLPLKISLYEEAPTPFSNTIRHELSAQNGIAAGAAAVSLLSPSSVPRDLLRWTNASEGYALHIGTDGVRIWASSGAGHLYGVITLGQVLRQYGRRLPCMAIGDQPALSRRGVQLCFPQGHTIYRPAYMQHLVRQLARWKINELYLYLESYFEFPSLPHMSGPGAMTPSQAQALDRLCRSCNIKLVPMLNTLAHCGELLATQRYQHLSEYPQNEDQRLVRPFNLCAGSKDVNALVDKMLEDLCACFSSDTIHVGGDEVSCIGKCPRCRSTNKKNGALALYARYFERILGVLERHGRKGGIWGDMLLNNCRTMTGHERERVLGRLRRKAIIYDWQYCGGSRKTIDFFVKAGLETIACSTTFLCYSSALWPAQAINQKALFKDAIAGGARGGMITGWANWNGLHEEHFNYLHASGAALLWSGASKTGFAGRLTPELFESAYSLQRYDMRSSALTDYLHVLGDASGPVLSVLAPLHGVELRKCLYHTDNVLTFWSHYSKILSGRGIRRYMDGVAKGRRLWNSLQKHPGHACDPYLGFLAGPLLMHEHLIARYRMTESVYRCYDQAARAQYGDPARFRALLDKSAARLEQHLGDFKPIEEYLAKGRAALGFDRSTINRIGATRRNLRNLAAFFRHLKQSHRPLPAFQQLHDVFLEQYRTRWHGDREHEWAAEIPRFQRYSINEPGAWTAAAAIADREWKGNLH